MKLADLTLEDLEALTDCAARETQMRKAVYPRQIERGKMTQEMADEELRCMQAITGLLKALRDEKAGFQELF